LRIDHPSRSLETKWEVIKLDVESSPGFVSPWWHRMTLGHLYKM
jgi:hypothetical protein